MYQRVPFGEPKPEFARRGHPRRVPDRVDRLVADARLHRRPRRLPRSHLLAHQPLPTSHRPAFMTLRFLEAEVNPGWDFHAIVPIIIVSATIVVVLIADFFLEYRGRFQTQQIASFGVLAAMIPVITLAVDGKHAVDVRRRVRGRPVLARLPGFFLAGGRRLDAPVGRLHRRRRLLPGRVLRPAAHVVARHDGDGERTLPGVDLRRTGDDLHPDVRPRGAGASTTRSRTRPRSSTT